MAHYARTRRRIRLAVRTAIAVAIAIPALGVEAADDDTQWAVRLEPVYVQANGHDPHVLTIGSFDFDSTPTSETRSAVRLDTESNVSFRAEVRTDRGPWSFGADILWFTTSQGRDARTGAAEGPSGTIDEVAFEIADRTYVSSGPGEVLYFSVLEDTDLAMWTADLYGERTLSEEDGSRLRLRFGLRLADFDNDFRAVVGVEDVGGTRIDASSNYERMQGPMLGLSGDLDLDRHRLRGSIGQSVVFGSVDLGRMARDFTGPADSPTYFAEELFVAKEDVAIPITDLRFDWTWEVGRRVALTTGALASVWWDVPVPPGAAPGGDSTALQESTVVLFGVSGGVELRF